MAELGPLAVAVTPTERHPVQGLFLVGPHEDRVGVLAVGAPLPRRVSRIPRVSGPVHVPLPARADALADGINQTRPGRKPTFISDRAR